MSGNRAVGGVAEQALGWPIGCAGASVVNIHHRRALWLGK